MKTGPFTTIEQAMDRKAIWVFTPSRTDPKDLEFILVQRQKLLQDAVERIRESALTGNKHYLLFVGPRGCGKTHLITLIVNRLSEDEELINRLRIAWLNEDETCTTLLEFLLKIHAALEKRYPDEYRGERITAAYDMKQDAALDFMAEQLLASLGSRTLLVVTENLDAIFEGLGDSGQKHLRAFLQENPRLCIVATAQRLTDDLSNRANPFYGFFQTEHLKPLNVEQATELLQNIARLQANNGVAGFLSTSRGRSRVRAIHHLSGGNHRIYIVLSQFITRDSVDALLEPFMKMVDELTPYYQERIRWLPPMQRKIVEYLCVCDGTKPVKEIARRLFATPQTISSQLGDLREKGYVDARQRGRESLYEISEPLMRICVEVKDNQRHQPLRLLVDFLRVWYEDQELKSRLGQLDPTSAACAYFESAIQRNDANGNLRRKILLDGIQSTLPATLPSEIREGNIQKLENAPEALLLAMQSMSEEKPTEAIRILDEAIKEESKPATTADLLLYRAEIHRSSGDLLRAIDDYTKVIGLEGAPVELVAMVLISRGMRFGQEGNGKRAIEDFTKVLTLVDAPVTQHGMALFHRGLMHNLAGDTRLAIEDYTTTINLRNSPIELVAMALVNRGYAHSQKGDNQGAIDDYTKVIELPNAPIDLIAKAFLGRGFNYGMRGDARLAIDDYTTVVNEPRASVELRANALFNRGFTYSQVGETERAIDDFTKVINLPGTPVETLAKALFNRGNRFGQTGDKQGAIGDYTTVLNLVGIPVGEIANALFNRGITYSHTGEKQRAIDDFTSVITIPDVPVETLAKALFHRGFNQAQEDKPQQAIDDFTSVINLSGAPVNLIARSLVNRGRIHGLADDTQRAFEDFTAVIHLDAVPLEQLALAFYFRGIANFQLSRKQESRADLTALLDLPEAPVELVVDAHLALAELHIGDGRWNEGFQSIEASLEYGTKAQPAYQPTPTELVADVFSAGLNPEGRRDKIRKLLNIYETNRSLAVLGESVVQHIGRVFRAGLPFPSTDNLEDWASAWEHVAESVPDFRLSVRLLRTGVDYVKAAGKDRGILYTLTSPERAIMEQALGLIEKTPTTNK